ncbi:histidine kinase [Oscillospiraceae bacterium PP1C4]
MLKFIIKKMSNIGLVWQITIVFSLIMIIPAIAITISYFQIFQDSLLKEAQKKMHENLNKMESNININLDSIDAMLNQLVFSQEFSYFLDANNVLSQREQNYYLSSVQEELISIRYIYPNRFNHIAIYSMNEQIKENYDWSYHMKNFYDHSYFDQMLHNQSKLLYGKVRYQDSIYDGSPKFDNLVNRDKLIFPVYQKIYNLSTKELVGMIEVNMTITKLVDEVSLADRETGTNYLLFSQSGDLIYRSDDRSGHEFGKLNFTGNSGTLDVVAGEANYMLAYKRCTRTGMMSAVVMSKEEILASTSGMEIMLVSVALLSVLIFILFTNLAARIMLRRLGDMDKMIAQIEAGKFNVHINETGFNEIARIAGSFNRMAARLQSVMNSMLEKEKAQREAELRALQAQINPHFLYNTLENMRMQCEIDEYYAVADSLAALGDLLRYSIKWDSPQVSLELEWNNLKNYISIMNMRFDENLTCEMIRAEGLESIIVPKMILQPIVENCFNHAFKNSFPPWIVKITASREDQRLVIVVEDNGVGINEQRLARIRGCMAENRPFRDVEKARSSIGVVNVNQRVDMVCPPGSGIQIESREGKGTRIVITIVIADQTEEGK